MPHSDITIVILSCASFSDTWSTHLSLLNKYWKERPNYILVSDGKGIFDLETDSNLLIINKDMSDRIIDVVSGVSTDYVLLVFDDHCLTNFFDNSKFYELLNYIKDNKIDYCGFSQNFKQRVKKSERKKIASKLCLTENYEVNFHTSIWKKSALLKCLKPSESVWKTEVRLTRRARENKLNCYGVTDNRFYPYIELIIKGKYFRNAYKYLCTNKLFVSDREIMSRRLTLKYRIRLFLSLHLPKFLLNFFRNIYRKFGTTIYSDYANTDD